jgi:hypothetical protein
MKVKLEPLEEEFPVQINLSYNEALSVLHVIHNLPENGYFPTMFRLEELLGEIVDDSYFDFG